MGWKEVTTAVSHHVLQEGGFDSESDCFEEILIQPWGIRLLSNSEDFCFKLLHDVTQ